MLLKEIKKYLDSEVFTPYFLFISDNQYSSTLNELSMEGLSFVELSDFCSADDKVPDIDNLLNYITNISNCTDNKKLVLKGLGEYLALMGNVIAAKELSKLKDYSFNNAKVILLLRGLSSQIAGLQIDPRFNTRRCSVIDNADCNLSITMVDPSIGLSGCNGFRSLLIELEKGQCGNIICNTKIKFDEALFIVYKINNAYDGIKFVSKEFTLPDSCGSETYWAELFLELNQNNNSILDVFKKYGFESNLENDFNTRITGNSYNNWIYYIALKCKTDMLTNNYLKYVLEKTSRFEDFSANVLNEIIEISHTDKRFKEFYYERKYLVKQFREDEIADFIINNRRIESESIYKLTDNTRMEREEIITWLSKNGIISQIGEIYPALADYLKKYYFKCPNLADMLTNYFEAYKHQKIINELEPDFIIKVDELAKSPRKFNQLPSRNEILEKLNIKDTFLYWLDALGVEYLAFIETLAQKLELSINIYIARAELPTITSFNRDFFDIWKGDKFNDKELDEIKHKEKGGYNFADYKLPNRNNFPIHLAKELDVISSIINKAATDLSLQRYKSFLIVSDHGASRLAVLRCKEEKYNTDTKGEHSGRCCKLFKPYNLPFAVEESNFLVLADYGRFIGSRAANVEVHGGASLEEVVIPIIELTMKNKDVTVKLVNEIIYIDFRSGIEIKMFINSPVQGVTIILNGKRYQTQQIDSNHYSAKLTDIKKAGNYQIDVYAGDDLIGNVSVFAQGKSGKINTDFDDLF